MNLFRTLLAAVCGFAMLWFYTKDMNIAMNWTFIALMALLLVPEKQKKSAEEESSSTQEK